MTRDFGVNQGLVEELYLRYKDNPSSVDRAWRRYFEQLDESPAAQNGMIRFEESTGNGSGSTFPAVDASTREMLSGIEPETGHRTSLPPSPGVRAATELQGRVSALISAHRERGHVFADIDPLGLRQRPPDELSLEAYGLADVEPDTMFSAEELAGPPRLPLREIFSRLKETYCRTIGVEFSHIDEFSTRLWLQEKMEASCNRLELSRDEQLLILSKLTDAEIFEQFLHTNYVGAKRFSLEGSESVIPMMELIVESAGRLGVEEIVIGMAHRGRLNVLVNVLEKNLREIFFAFEDHNPELNLGRGDVKYHMGYSSDRVTKAGHKLHLTLSFNPSHLEFVDPVVEGRVRAKQDRREDQSRTTVLPLLIHGDAAFVGQGVVAETLNLSRLKGYCTGGTVHIVINNQIGFTTMPEDARSTTYATDLTRMLQCPIFHVNGEDPEAVAQAVLLATEFRQKFARDVVIDLYTYRKYGHNEADEPRFTQPVMYAAIDRKQTVRQVYVHRLVEMGNITEAEADALVARRRQIMEGALAETRTGNFVPPDYSMGGVWQGYKGGADADVPEAETAVPVPQLQEQMRRLCDLPSDFHPHPKIKRLMDQRLQNVLEHKPFDWGTAETLALSSIVAEGIPVRLTGQDSRRGTFSHRHATLFDIQDGRTFTPLERLVSGNARLEIIDSPLSEAGVLGFEYGYSLDCPEGLIVWEAQFGDFANAAQVIVDQFISSSEDKWHRLNGLVMLLPHGFEGQGPEHSSARLERFMTLCAEDNMQVCNLTTPAQLFHCLRRQVRRVYRKPLVIMSPKSLLRHPLATSTVDDLAKGSFHRILADSDPLDAGKVTRVILCSGKVYYDLLQARRERDAGHIALLRVEQLYPLRDEHLRLALSPYPHDAELVWVQEEPANMGAWCHVYVKFPQLIGRPIRGVTRDESSSPATGSLASHKLEQQRLIDEALA